MVIVVIVVFVVFMVFMRTTFRTIAMEVLVVRSVVVMALCKEPAQSCLKSQKRRESSILGGRRFGGYDIVSCIVALYTSTSSMYIDQTY